MDLSLPPKVRKLSCTQEPAKFSDLVCPICLPRQVLKIGLCGLCWLTLSLGGSVKMEWNVDQGDSEEIALVPFSQSGLTVKFHKEQIRKVNVGGLLPLDKWQMNENYDFLQGLQHYGGNALAIGWGRWVFDETSHWDSDHVQIRK